MSENEKLLVYSMHGWCGVFQHFVGMLSFTSSFRTVTMTMLRHSSMGGGSRVHPGGEGDGSRPVVLGGV